MSTEPEDPTHLEPLKILVSDTATASSEFVLRGAAGGIESLRTGNDRVSSSADLQDDGSIRHSIQGRLSQNEESTRDACDRLGRRLYPDRKIAIAEHRPGDKEIGVDCKICDENGKQLAKVQVVRAHIDQSLYRQTYQTGYDAATDTPQSLADKLHDAINHKREFADAGIILALDAKEFPEYAFPQVIADFQTRHSAWIREIRFKEIWLVGPDAASITRLDGHPAIS